MTSTIVRVKRRLEESPLDALVVHCKRPRREECQEVSPAVFVFSGTTVKQEDNATCHIKKAWLRKHNNAMALESAKGIPTLLNQIKDDHKENTQNNRIKIVNYSRGLTICPEDVDATEEPKADTSYALLDLLHSEDGKVLPKDESEGQFVYDLYLSQHTNFNVEMVDDIVRIDPYHNTLVFVNKDAPSSDENDSEDSNDENNWRNEYPDTDDSIQEDDIVRAMGRARIGDEDSDLSSDAGEEELVYGNPNIRAHKHLDNAIDSDDVDRYGLSYAKYKAKLRTIHKGSSSGLIQCAGQERSDYSSSDENYLD